jgi:hypothetical protein
MNDKIGKMKRYRIRETAGRDVRHTRRLASNDATARVEMRDGSHQGHATGRAKTCDGSRPTPYPVTIHQPSPNTKFVTPLFH